MYKRSVHVLRGTPMEWLYRGYPLTFLVMLGEVVDGVVVRFHVEDGGEDGMGAACGAFDAMVEVVSGW